MNKKIETKYLLMSSLILSLIVFVFFAIAYLVVNYLGLTFWPGMVVFLISAVVLSFLITVGFTAISQTISDAMITLRRMLRWENLSNPLLLKLSMEAPGTYHHSLIVSTMSQRACRAVGANSLLVRTAAYYHDIGKLKNPKIYIENQSEDEIPQNEDPDNINEKSEKIIAHVEEGVRVAEENNLPEEIIRLLAEHHGTSRALYFYEKAKSQGIRTRKTDFRYKGPIPSSKEAAILMLADCSEAAARSEESLTKEKITELVTEIIEEKLSDGQLKDADLSEMDIAKIRSSLIETLQVIYHQRIKYDKR